MDLKIIFIGLGSIAERHILNLCEILKSRNINYQIDVLRSSKSSISPNIKRNIKCIYYDYKNVPENYDITFITNPTELHEKYVKKFSSKTKHMFIEKPVFSTTNIDFSQLNLNPKGIYYVACPLRYKDTIQYVRERIKLDNVISIRAICSTYLPNWRPHLDYRNTYSARKDLGGGVSIDLIHEWDYITYLVGFPTEIKTIISKKSNLDIDSDDIGIYIGSNDRTTYELHVDYYGRKEIREFELFTIDDTIKIDLINNTIVGSKINLQFIEERNDFQKKELNYFLDIITKGYENTNDIQRAVKVLKIAKGEM